MLSPRVLWLAAALFIVIGLSIGLAPVKPHGEYCGTAFHQNIDEGLFPEHEICQEARSGRQPYALGAFGIALLVGIAGAARHNPRNGLESPTKTPGPTTDAEMT